MAPSPHHSLPIPFTFWSLEVPSFIILKKTFANLFKIETGHCFCLMYCFSRQWCLCVGGGGFIFWIFRCQHFYIFGLLVKKFDELIIDLFIHRYKLFLQATRLSICTYSCRKLFFWMKLKVACKAPCFFIEFCIRTRKKYESVSVSHSHLFTKIIRLVVHFRSRNCF